MRSINVILGATDISNADPFDYVGANDVLSHSDKGYAKFLGMAGDWHNLVLVVSIIAALLTVSWIFIRMMGAKQGKKRAELKDLFTWKIILLIIIESMGTIFGVVTKLAMSMAT